MRLWAFYHGLRYLILAAPFRVGKVALLPAHFIASLGIGNTPLNVQERLTHCAKCLEAGTYSFTPTFLPSTTAPVQMNCGTFSALANAARAQVVCNILTVDFTTSGIACRFGLALEPEIENLQT